MRLSTPPLPVYVTPEAKEPLFCPSELTGEDLDFDLDVTLQSGGRRRSRTRREHEMEEIRKKLAYLNWKKRENDFRVREIVNTSRKMEERDLLLRLSTNHNEEKALRLQKIISEEMRKPLLLAEPFVKDYEVQEVSAITGYLRVSIRPFLESQEIAGALSKKCLSLSLQGLILSLFAENHSLLV
jgi:hypothetical protein